MENYPGQKFKPMVYARSMSLGILRHCKSRVRFDQVAYRSGLWAR